MVYCFPENCKLEVPVGNLLSMEATIRVNRHEFILLASCTESPMRPKAEVALPLDGALLQTPTLLSPSIVLTLRQSFAVECQCCRGGGGDLFVCNDTIEGPVLTLFPVKERREKIHVFNN